MDALWTVEQEAAITARNSDLLVAAAAGSGKTAVLVERVIRRVLEEGQEIDRMLVVTFTNAAAAEMRQRIGEAIAKELEKAPHNVHLQNQMAFLHRADIKTIHAFCLQLLREYYHILEIDPAARTADPAEIRLLQKEVLGDLFEELYQAEENQWFLELLEIFGENTKDTALRALVLHTYAFAMSDPYPEQLLDRMAEAYHLPEGVGIETCEWFGLIRQSVQEKAAFALEYLQRALKEIAGVSGFEGYQKCLQAEVSAAENFVQVLSGSYQEWSLAYTAIDFARLPGYRGEETEIKEQVQAWRDAAKDILKKEIGEKYFRYTAEMQAELLRSMYPAVKGLGRVTKLFLEAFQRAKLEKNIIDFTDYEHFSLRLLIDAKGQPTEIAEEIRSRYDEIMIDEYQDSNQVQELLLSAISGESIRENNRFMVGDVKQSIVRP